MDPQKSARGIQRVRRVRERGRGSSDPAQLSTGPDAACTFRGQSATTGFAAATSPFGCVARSHGRATAVRGEPLSGPRDVRALRGCQASLGSSTGRDWATVPADRSPVSVRDSRARLGVGGESVGIPPDPS